MIIADPPYNIGKDFGNDSDRRSLQNYIEWSQEWLDACLSHLADTGIAYIYGYSEILAHLAVRFPIDRQRWLVWHYTNKAVPGSQFWQRSHETILCLWLKDRPQLHIDAIREKYTENYKKCIGRVRAGTESRFSKNGKQTIYIGHEGGALPRDVIKIPALAGGAGRKERWFLCRTCGSNIFPPSELPNHREHDIVKHPTQKPIALTKRLILSAINGSGVLIPFAGSGSECVAAQQLGTEFFATEINPEYADFGNKWLLASRGDQYALPS